MKLDAIPQNPLEWLILKSGMVPTPLGHGHIGFLLSRAILDAVDLDVIEVLKDQPLKLEEIAEKCGLKAHALRSLMNILAAAGYVSYKSKKFKLTNLSRKWLLKDSKHSVYDLMVLNSRVCWSWMEDYKDYLKTGKTIDYHERLTDEEWVYYQKAMASAARVQSKELARRTPVPKGAKKMLDIGGSHGLHSLALCKKHKLKSDILELPDAIEIAKEVVKNEVGVENISYQPANVLTDELGENEYDLVLISSLTHHFTDEQNIMIAKKVNKALKSGGYYIIMDFERPKTQSNADLIGMANDMFFSFTSNGGTYSQEEMKDWLREGGLEFFRTLNMLTMPGTVQVVGRKN
ncbi:MAG: methyltransferase [Candidatus Cyclobacteriaceae bacterium M2_1C_046]